ncbi:MAG TPA: acyltransferase family protein [Pseudonocardia sp.]|jgi:peptidoglycan/LPS O-acetylase OafA/YrhL|uniref:acyltransferase family protein n=1 Tax=Pseudonocardia sp. TaxID=60912 RepID=UPI002B4AE263|nr:acyltransferase family protein [Pseudonocardia sp.]HLU60511.1 acyltransferase family protein [Pseudonocardia sp.]
MTPRDQHGGLPTAGVGQKTGFRPELQGLRALAVLLVVVYHVWIGRVSGGVDVFFFVSGYLLTGQLLRAAERGELDVRARWMRSLARLVPAAAVVLVATAGAAALVLPEGRWGQTVREIAAAALFLENWQLAADSVDYAARNNVVSVAQHFWSLSVQVQVFLLWPLLFAVVAIACRGAADKLHRTATLVLAGVFATSLVYSIELTITNQPLAYFHTLTRLWEFALGGLLALHGHRIALTRRGRVAAGWAGVVALVACGAVIPVAHAFPGIAALWPTGAAALVLLAGQTGAALGADRLLVAAPARYLGDISYALYLWHWPLLVLYQQGSGRQDVGLAAGALIIAAATGLAALTYECLEKPLNRRRGGLRRQVRITAAGTAAVLAVALVWQLAAVSRADTEAVLGDDAHPGARALLSDEEVPPAPYLPSAVAVTEDWVRIERWDCTQMSGFPMDMCAQPLPVAEDTQEPLPPDRRIVVVGDSHAQQLTGALLPIAERNNWQIITIVRGACPFSTASEVVPDDQDCLAWNAAAAEEIIAMRPDAVVTLASRDVRAGQTEQTPAGFVEQWRRLDAEGIPVIALRDNPRFDHSIPDCVQTRPDDIDGCGGDRAEFYAPTPPWAGLPDVPDNVTFVDTADAVCDAHRCPPVIGNVLVYMDDNHLTATYSTSMSDLLASRIEEGLGW